MCVVSMYVKPLSFNSNQPPQQNQTQASAFSIKMLVVHPFVGPSVRRFHPVGRLLARSSSSSQWTPEPNRHSSFQNTTPRPTLYWSFFPF